MPDRNDPEAQVAIAANAVSARADFASVLNGLSRPVYVCDADGRILFWNNACAPFAGRQPTPDDRWCVTWQLYTTEGAPLPHDECPMAVAIKERRTVRDEVAIAVRPDGGRVAFRPYPTPLFDENGTLTGAVNLLVDVSDEQAGTLARQAERCRRLSKATHDRETATMLDSMADTYDSNAAALRRD